MTYPIGYSMDMTNASQLTSNQLYRGLNNRFEKRSAILRRLGFKYRQVCTGVAVFTRDRLGREKNITAAEVIHAGKIAWIDALRTL